MKYLVILILLKQGTRIKKFDPYDQCYYIILCLLFLEFWLLKTMLIWEEIPLLVLCLFLWIRYSIYQRRRHRLYQWRSHTCYQSSSRRCHRSPKKTTFLFFFFFSFLQVLLFQSHKQLIDLVFLVTLKF